MLDLIDQYDKIQDINYKRYNEFIRDTISSYKQEELKIVKRLAKDYGEFVAKVLLDYLYQLNKCKV